MATKLYVGNLSFQTTDQDLRELFADMGDVVSAQVITDRYTGQSRGFGFVEMSNEDQAQQAIAAVNGRNVGGRALVVNESRPQAPREGGSRGGGGYGGGGNYGGGGGYGGGGNRGGGGGYGGGGGRGGGNRGGGDGGGYDRDRY